MTDPVPFVSSEVAQALRLSQKPNAIHVGYWRDTKEPGEHAGYYGCFLRHAEENLAKLAAGESLGYCSSVDRFGGDWEAYLRHDIAGCTKRRDLTNLLPWPGDHCDPEMPEAERARIAELLFKHNAGITMRYQSPSWDRLMWDYDKIGEWPWESFGWGGPLATGSGEVHHAGYVWPEGLFRYVQRYGLLLPPDFLAAIA